MEQASANGSDVTTGDQGEGEEREGPIEQGAVRVRAQSDAQLAGIFAPSTC